MPSIRRTIVFWGGNDAETRFVDYPFVREAQRRGARVVCIDPNRSVTASQGRYLDFPAPRHRRLPSAQPPARDRNAGAARRGCFCVPTPMVRFWFARTPERFCARATSPEASRNRISSGSLRGRSSAEHERRLRRRSAGVTKSVSPVVRSSAALLRSNCSAISPRNYPARARRRDHHSAGRNHPRAGRRACDTQALGHPHRLRRGPLVLVGLHWARVAALVIATGNIGAPGGGVSVHSGTYAPPASMMAFRNVEGKSLAFARYDRPDERDRIRSALSAKGAVAHVMQYVQPDRAEPEAGAIRHHSAVGVPDRQRTFHDGFGGAGGSCPAGRHDLRAARPHPRHVPPAPAAGGRAGR